MDQREAELNTSSFSNSTRSVFYCPKDPQLPWDLHDTTSPWIFAAVASIISPTAVLLNVPVIIAVTQRKELQRASNILLSSMAVTDLLVGSLCVPLSAVVGLLSVLRYFSLHKALLKRLLSILESYPSYRGYSYSRMSEKR